MFHHDDQVFVGQEVSDDVDMDQVDDVDMDQVDDVDHDDGECEERQLLQGISDDLPSSNSQNEEDPLNIENNTEAIIQPPAGEQLLASDMSDSEDEEDVHFNENGQRVKPSRAQDECEEYSDDDDVPAPAATTAAAITRPSTSVERSTETPGSGSSWTRSRGKGGRRLAVVNNRLETRRHTPEELSNLKNQWKQWLSRYKEEIQQILNTNSNTSHFDCSECGKKITRAGLIRHKTLQGCKNMRWETKLMNWKN